MHTFFKNAFLRDRWLSDNMEKTYFYVTSVKHVKIKNLSLQSYISI